jgi:hypothetical protein
MPCFHPITAYHKIGGGITWTHRESNGIKLTVSCKQCTGCRQEYARQWAMRNIHEASLWLNNIFITLTYNDQNLPEHNKLVKKDFQDFMKRLRKHKKANTKNPIRFFHCGEYGEKFGRPHYHAILFNTNFNDRKPLPGQKNLTTSDTLKKLWGKGHVSIGDVTFQSASYVAGYVQKKINGKQKEDHYRRIDKTTGETWVLPQEYATMSRRPGIAGLWFAKHKKDVYPSDNIHINGIEMRPPKYYDNLFQEQNPLQMEQIKENRTKAMQKTAHLRTPQALAQAKRNHQARMSLHKRGKL